MINELRVEQAKGRILRCLARNGGAMTKSQLRSKHCPVPAVIYNKAFESLVESGEISLRQANSAKHGTPPIFVSVPEHE